ncbi:MAG: sulfatase [Candidatus Eisenbacteria bacterium]|nr:sulfatase [Candidatus Eisenbacteria bacterium]
MFGRRTIGRTRGIVAASLALPLLAGCGSGDERPHVILVTLDTTRKDHLSPYGNGWIATPTLEAVAAEGALFENAFAPIPMTRPSHASMFTGLYPRSHGVRNNTRTLYGDRPMLAPLFSGAGYATYGVVSTGLFREESGFTRGFENFTEKSDPLQGAATTVDRAIEFLREGAEGGRPFFLWVHLFDPHFPYGPPGGWADRYGRDAYPGMIAATLEELARGTAETGGDVTGPMLERIRGLYAGEVSYMDEELGRLIREIDRLGVRERTLLAILSDHGEAFDHDFYFNHDRTLYESTVSIAWMLRWPGRIRPGRITAPVEAVDLAPTLLELAGLSAPEAMQGRSLVPLLSGGSLPERPVILATPDEVDDAFLEKPRRLRHQEDRDAAYRTVLGRVPLDRLPFPRREAIVLDGWKLILDGDEPVELYHLPEDPGEERNRIAEEGGRVRDLLDEYARRIAEIPLEGGETEAPSEETVERLRALGYVD